MAVESAVAKIAQEGKYLSFILGKEEYGLEILKVQEINGLMPITPVPRSPGYVRGVINLRGKVVPIVCLRERFRMPRVPDTEKTCVIVVQVQFGEQQITMGIIVDEVSEVLNIARDQIEGPPGFGNGTEEADFVTGMGKLEDKVVILLDIDALLGDRALAGILEEVAG